MLYSMVFEEIIWEGSRIETSPSSKPWMKRSNPITLPIPMVWIKFFLLGNVSTWRKYKEACVYNEHLEKVNNVLSRTHKKYGGTGI